MFFTRDLHACRASRDDRRFAATRIVRLRFLVVVIDDGSKESSEPIGKAETILEVLRVKLINMTSKKPRGREGRNTEGGREDNILRQGQTDERDQERKRDTGVRWAHADGSREHISKVCSQLIMGIPRLRITRRMR